MITKLPFHKLETGLLFTFGMVIFLSKPAIYLVSLLLLVVTATHFLLSAHYRRALLEHQLFWGSVALFMLGILGVSVGSTFAADVGWIAKKTMLLLLVVPFLLAFEQQSNRIAALAGVVLGFWIAFVLTGDMHNWSWSGQRLEGATWLVDAWGVICAMLIVVLTPFVFFKQIGTVLKGILVVTILAATLMLVTNGARGAWLGAAAGVFVYLLIKQRLALMVVCTMSAVALLVASTIWPEQTESFKLRAQSITNTKTDASNYIRLALWETGSALIQKNVTSGDKKIWLGHGHQGHVASSTKFYRDEFSQQAAVRPGLLNETTINDFHNMYIQSIVQNGILWTVGILFFLLWLGFGPLKKGYGFTKTWAATPTLLAYLVTGVTYTLLPHFAFMFLIYFLSLGRGFDTD